MLCMKVKIMVHVAYVTAVNNDGTIEVLEANWGGNQQIGNYRGAFTPSSDAYYIYPKQLICSRIDLRYLTAPVSRFYLVRV